jgi:hypothetical protein
MLSDGMHIMKAPLEAMFFVKARRRDSRRFLAALVTDEHPIATHDSTRVADHRTQGRWP